MVTLTANLQSRPLAEAPIKQPAKASVLPPIYFYIPQDQWPAIGIPEDISAHWQVFGPGVFAWTLQTYLRLKADGFPCELVGTIPTEGVIIAHRDSVPCSWKPTAKQLFVCIQADRSRHPWAHFHIVHNPQGLLSQQSYRIESSYYIPHWAPQPGLIPRDPARGDRFENIAFFGHERNLDPQLKDPSWQAQLAEMGLTWRVVDRDRWNDYSDVDAVIAVRSFSEQDFDTKPALKLYNAWHAGVPAILGCESAFRAERKTDLDYFEVSSREEAIAALQYLRDYPEARYAIIQNGQIRAEETRATIHIKMWRDLLLGTVVPAYRHWSNAASWQIHAFFASHSFAHNLERVKRQVSKFNRSRTAASIAHRLVDQQS